MKFDPDIYHRRSIRLKEYDYSNPGGYFVTICTKNRECLFGDIKEGVIKLTSFGEIVERLWFEIPDHFENIFLDQFVVMPNHIHGIIIIFDEEVQNAGVKNVGVQYIEPLHAPLQKSSQNRTHQFQKIIPGSLGSIIRSYKSSVTRWCKKNGHGYFQWLRNYYEHIIRSEKELTKIRQYIIDNPLKWEFDQENPKNWSNNYDW